MTDSFLIRKETRCFLLLFLLCCFGCKREDAVPEIKPLLKTNPIVINGSEGVFLSGEFILCPWTIQYTDYFNFLIKTKEPFNCGSTRGFVKNGRLYIMDAKLSIISVLQFI